MIRITTFSVEDYSFSNDRIKPTKGKTMLTIFMITFKKDDNLMLIMLWSHVSFVHSWLIKWILTDQIYTHKYSWVKKYIHLSGKKLRSFFDFLTYSRETWFLVADTRLYNSQWTNRYRYKSLSVVIFLRKRSFQRLGWLLSQRSFLDLGNN